MIKLFDNWVVDVDPNNYTLARITGTKTLKAKDGKEIETEEKKVYGYFPDLSGALKALSKELARARHMDGVNSLQEALAAIFESEEMVENLVEEAVDG